MTDARIRIRFFRSARRGESSVSFCSAARKWRFNRIGQSARAHELMKKPGKNIKRRAKKFSASRARSTVINFMDIRMIKKSGRGSFFSRGCVSKRFFSVCLLFDTRWKEDSLPNFFFFRDCCGFECGDASTPIRDDFREIKILNFVFTLTKTVHRER